MNDQPPPNAVHLLKELLFDGEARRLEDLSRRLEQEVGDRAQRDKALGERIDVVFDRAGTEERLLHSVAAIIDGALREAEVTRHEEVSRAIAPLVVRTIKVQLRESQDEMVDALYPITGRLVKSYVQAEINRLMIEINAKLGGARPITSANNDRSGLTPADLALAATNDLQVEEIFLVRRGSGDLVSHWERPGARGETASPLAAGSNRDVLLSGYISGIMSLSEEAFGASPGSFRTLTFSGGDRIFVRGAAAHLLAVRCSGSAPATVENVIDEVFLDTLERYQQLLASEIQQGGREKLGALLPAVARDIEARTEQRRDALGQQPAPPPARKPSFGRLYALATVIAAPFVLWGAWSAYQAFETVRVESAAARVLETVDEVAGMPPKIEVERGGRALTISGFVPTAELRDRIIDRLGQELPQASIRNRLGVLPKDAREFEAALARWRSTSEQQFQELASNAIARSVARTHARIETIRDSSVQLAERTASPAQAQQLRRALDIAAERSLVPAAGAAIDHGQLSALWQALNDAERVLANLAAGRAASSREAGVPSADAGQLAEACATLADRMGASVVALLAARIDSLQPTARDEAEAFIRRSVVFFANNTDFRDTAAADALLEQIARRLRDNATLKLRVVGYTDERGSQSLNSNLAQLRADHVAAALAERGIAASRIIAVGRPVGKELTRNAGPTSSNRRVEFEIGYPEELDAAP